MAMFEMIATSAHAVTTTVRTINIAKITEADRIFTAKRFTLTGDGPCVRKQGGGVFLLLS